VKTFLVETILVHTTHAWSGEYANYRLRPIITFRKVKLRT